MTNPQKPAIISGWERGKSKLRRLAKLANLDYLLHICTKARERASLSYLVLALFGAGDTDAPITAVGFVPTLPLKPLTPDQSLSKINHLFYADLLTGLPKTLIIDAYLGDSKMAKDKKVEPTKAQLVREVEAKLGFRKFELNSLERANKATIVALLGR